MSFFFGFARSIYYHIKCSMISLFIFYQIQQVEHIHDLYDDLFLNLLADAMHDYCNNFVIITRIKIIILKFFTWSKFDWDHECWGVRTERRKLTCPKEFPNKVLMTKPNEKYFWKKGKLIVVSK